MFDKDDVFRLGTGLHRAVFRLSRGRILARVASDEEKAALWPAIVAAYGNYGGYQKKTERDIPVVLLTPAV